MSEKQRLPLGRTSIRKNASGIVKLGEDPHAGRPNDRINLWEFGQATPGSPMAKLERAYMTALDAVDSIDTFKETLAKSGELTPAGIAAASLKRGLTELAPTLKRSKLAIEAARNEAVKRREQIKLRPLDPSDIRAEIRQGEIRSFLRAMPEKERAEFINRQIDNIAPEIAEAILMAPPELSGVAESQRTVLLDRALEAQHGEAVREIVELERAVEVAERAVEAARDQIRVMNPQPQPHGPPKELAPHEFNALAAPFESKVAAPWLRKFKDGDGEAIKRFELIDNPLIPGKKDGAWRHATETDIAEGIFFETADEFYRANPELAEVINRAAA